jgi:hypothetical protein
VGALSVVERWAGFRRDAFFVRPFVVSGFGAAGIRITRELVASMAELVRRRREEARRSEGSLLERVFTPPVAFASMAPSMAVGVVDSDAVTVREADGELPAITRSLGALYKSLRLPTKSTARQNAPEMYNRLVANENGALDALREWRRELLEAVGPDKLEMIMHVRSMPGTGGAVDIVVNEKIDPQLLKKPVFKVTVSVRPDVTKLLDPIDYKRSITWSIEKTQKLLDEGRIDAVVMVANEVLPAVRLALANPNVMLPRLEEALRWAYEEPYEPHTAARYLAAMARLARIEADQANDLAVKATAPLTTYLAVGHAVGLTLRMAQGGPTDVYNVKEQVKRSWIAPSYLPEEMAGGVKEAIEKLLVTALAPTEMWAADRILVVVGAETAKKLGLKGPALADEVESILYDHGYAGSTAVLTVSNARGWWMYICHRRPPALYTMEVVMEVLKQLREG